MLLLIILAAFLMASSLLFALHPPKCYSAQNFGELSIRVRDEKSQSKGGRVIGGPTLAFV
jgi:hypothetical protein